MAMSRLRPVGACAQATVSTSDIQRLQDRIYDASGDISRVRTRNADEAATLARQQTAKRKD